MKTDLTYIILTAVAAVVICSELLARFGKGNDTLPDRRELFIGQRWYRRTRRGNYVTYGTVLSVDSGTNKVTLAIFNTESPETIELKWNEDIDDFQMQIARGSLIEENND